MGRIMKRDQPGTPDEWLEEIRLAMADARNTKPFGLLTGQVITDSNLFHLAPLVCMKFRGLDSRNEKLRKKVTEGHWQTMSPTPVPMESTTGSNQDHCWHLPCVTSRLIMCLI